MWFCLEDILAHIRLVWTTSMYSTLKKREQGEQWSLKEKKPHYFNNFINFFFELLLNITLFKIKFNILTCFVKKKKNGGLIANMKNNIFLDQNASSTRRIPWRKAFSRSSRNEIWKYIVVFTYGFHTFVVFGVIITIRVSTDHSIVVIYGGVLSRGLISNEICVLDVTSIFGIRWLTVRVIIFLGGGRVYKKKFNKYWFLYSLWRLG